MADRVGQQLGNYRLLRLLGRGGFAEVYLGEHLYLKSRVALKVLHTQLTAEDAQRFVQEAQTLARLSHPHIVRVLDFAIQEGLPFLVMEYAPGGTLRTRHPRQTRLPLETIVAYVNQVAQALQYAHDHRLIHRDVKPENMLLSSKDDVLLSDFGLAMLAPPTLSASTRPIAERVVGTSPYLAPEQLQGEAGPASDQYALGVVVYEWLTGTPPFHGSPLEIAMQHLSMPPPALAEQVPDLPPAVEEVILRTFAKDPKLRFASVHDFASTLEQASHESAPAQPTPLPTKETEGAQRGPAAQPLHIQLLGEFRLVSGETPVTSIDTPRLQSLLAYLLLHHSAPQSRSHLAFLLWPDSTESQAHTNLRTSVHRLRQALSNANAFLHADRQGLQWHPEVPWTLDVLDFEQALAHADQSRDPRVVRQALTQAVTLYRGDLLPNCYDEWILPERDRLRQSFLAALERLIGVLEEARDYPAAISAAQRLLRHDPLREAAYRQLMHLYATSGDRAAALRTYHACATVLERELATEPSRATRDAYERLLQAEEPLSPREAPRAPLVAQAPLIGRTREWAQLQEAWRVTMTGRPHLVVLLGEAGIGKTRLAEELMSWVRRQGLPFATARCYATEEGLAYTPVRAWLHADALRTGLSALPALWLTEVARLLPDLLVTHPDLPRPDPLMEGWQREHFFEALARAMLGTGQPLLLVLDDLQWCDRETLAWLHYLLRFDPGARLLLVGTQRSEELTPENPLVSFLLVLRREALLTEIDLGPLDAAETASLAEHVAQRELPSRLAAALYQETEGNPLFVVESVRAGVLPQEGSESQAAGLTAPRPTPPISRLPASVQAALAARLAQLSSVARELVNVAAVIGRTFTFPVLEQASGRDEDTVVRALDELWQRRILREQESLAYDFSHDKLREQAYVTLSTARRRLLHQRVLQALQATAASPAQLAHHALHAGKLELAFHLSVEAGDEAMGLFAIREAILHYEQAELVMAQAGGHTQDIGVPIQELHHLYMQLGRVYELNDAHEQAQRVYDAMLDLARARHEPSMECAALNRQALLTTWMSFDMARATKLLHEALGVAEQSGDEVGLAETQWSLACINFYAFDAREALLHAERALMLARTHDLQDLLARSLNIMAYAKPLLGKWEGAAVLAEEARAVYRALGNRVMEADCLNAQAQARIYCGHIQEGVTAARTAYAITQEIKNTWGQAFSAMLIALGLHDLGTYSEALMMAQQSVFMGKAPGFPSFFRSLFTLGLVQLTLHTPEAAHQTLGEAATLIERSGESPLLRQFMEGTIAAMRCMECALLEDWTQAYAYALQAQAVRDVHLSYVWPYTLCFETEALVRGGDLERAMDGVQHLRAYMGESRRSRVPLLHASALLASWQGETEQALAHLHEAAAFAAEIGLRGEQWQIEAALGDLRQKRGEEQQAHQAYARAAEMVEALARDMQDEQLQQAFRRAVRVQRVFRGQRTQLP